MMMMMVVHKNWALVYMAVIDLSKPVSDCILKVVTHEKVFFRKSLSKVT